MEYVTTKWRKVTIGIDLLIEKLDKKYDYDSLDDMPELFVLAETEESPMYFMEYEEIAFIRW